MRTSVPDAIVAAHPDDEILGLGVLLPTLNRQFTVIHVTDGAPRSGDDARQAGCAGWRDYADLRRHEFHRALAAAGGTEGMLVRLNCADQEACFHIAEHARELAALFDELRPSTVFTHAYEGGHPDHDATAASVHAAAHLAHIRPMLVEFGRLYYQRFSWAIEPSAWRDMARQSFQRLGVPCVC